MTKSSKKVDVYLEVGKKKVLAGALEWPGWCRGGRDEESALQALAEYGPRYESVMSAAGIDFSAPKDASAFDVAERLKGNATTDYGVPHIPPSVDAEKKISAAEMLKLQAILEACWEAFDAAVKVAGGKELRKGPRGGGRDVAGIVEHVVGAEASYLSSLGGKAPKGSGDPEEDLDLLRRAVFDTLAASARGEIDPVGPRGGARWSARYFVRRAAWHVLDHVWEIEDRVL
jgi:hypothetical protein